MSKTLIVSAECNKSRFVWLNNPEISSKEKIGTDLLLYWLISEFSVRREQHYRALAKARADKKAEAARAAWNDDSNIGMRQENPVLGKYLKQEWKAAYSASLNVSRAQWNSSKAPSIPLKWDGPSALLQAMGQSAHPKARKTLLKRLQWLADGGHIHVSAMPQGNKGGIVLDLDKQHWPPADADIAWARDIGVKVYLPARYRTHVTLNLQILCAKHGYFKTYPKTFERGDLYEQIGLAKGRRRGVPDERIRSALQELNAINLGTEFGHIDVTIDWDKVTLSNAAARKAKLRKAKAKPRQAVAPTLTKPKPKPRKGYKAPAEDEFRGLRKVREISETEPDLGIGGALGGKSLAEIFEEYERQERHDKEPRLVTRSRRGS